MHTIIILLNQWIFNIILTIAILLPVNKILSKFIKKEKNTSTKNIKFIVLIIVNSISVVVFTKSFWTMLYPILLGFSFFLVEYTPRISVLKRIILFILYSCLMPILPILLIFLIMNGDPRLFLNICHRINIYTPHAFMLSSNNLMHQYLFYFYLPLLIMLSIYFLNLKESIKQEIAIAILTGVFFTVLKYKITLNIEIILFVMTTSLIYIYNILLKKMLDFTPGQSMILNDFKPNNNILIFSIFKMLPFSYVPLLWKSRTLNNKQKAEIYSTAFIYILLLILIPLIHNSVLQHKI